MMAGVQSQQLVRSYLVYDMTDSAFLLGVVNAASALPMLFLSLFGGALADRLDRKRLIQAGQGAIMVIAVAVAVLVYTCKGRCSHSSHPPGSRLSPSSLGRTGSGTRWR